MRKRFGEIKVLSWLDRMYLPQVTPTYLLI